MKYLLYFKVFAFIFVINSALAQEGGFLIDSTRETYTMGYGTYTITKQYYYYNNYNQLKFLDTYTNKNSFPDTADWQNTGNEYHYYDSQQRVVQDLYLSREIWENSWSEKYKTVHEYSDTTTIKTFYSWDFASGNWNNGEVRNIDTLKVPEELETSHLRQYRFDQSGPWENDLWVDSFFIQAGMIDSIYKTYWVAGDSSATHSYVTQYDYTFYPDTLLIYYWDIGYYTLSKIYYTEDSLRKYKLIYQITNDTIIDTLSRTIHYFDDEQREIKYEYARWNPTNHDWIPPTIITYEYNEKGLLIQKDYCSLGAHQRTKYEYNDDDLLRRKIYYSDVHDLSHFTTDYYYYSYTYVSTPEQVANNFQKIVFYPNPSNSVIHFNWNTDTKKRYMIYDVTGRMVTLGKLFSRENTIDVSSLVSGYYVIVIDSGDKISQGRFIKY